MHATKVIERRKLQNVLKYNFVEGPQLGSTRQVHLGKWTRSTMGGPHFHCSLSKIANTELKILENWLLANKLSLSIGIDKETKFSFFTTNKNEQKDNLPNLKLLNQNLPQTDYVKYLGVLLDDCLTFKNHISKLCDKLKKYTGVFYLLRHNLPKH